MAIYDINGKAVMKRASFGNYFHISFDDVRHCMGNLKNNTYTSVWNEPFFGFLKTLHDTYKAVFSLYLYDISTLSNVPTTYKTELFQARDWLKLSLHAKLDNNTFENASAEDGANAWNTLVTQVIRFTGSTDSVDRIPRLDYYQGSQAALTAMRDCNCGALGFLSATGSQVPYYLTQAQYTYLQDHDLYIDWANGLYFLHTDMCGDWFASDFTSESTHRLPTEDNVYDDLIARYQQAIEADTFRSYIWFAHEWKIYNGTALNAYKQWVIDACRFADDYNIPFDYPQNRLTEITSNAVT